MSKDKNLPAIKQERDLHEVLKNGSLKPQKKLEGLTGELGLVSLLKKRL